MGQECLHQQINQAYKEGFKLSLPEEGDGVLSNKEEPGAADVLGANRETLVKYLKENRAYSSKKVTRSTAQLRCLYTNACSMGCKQETSCAARKL